MFFDLSEQNDEILNGRSVSDFSISYHYSRSDAEAKSNEITQSIEVQYQNDKTIFYRLEDNSNSSLFEIDSFDLKIIRTEVMSDEKEFCGNSEGFTQFKLGDLDDRMLNFQDPNNSQDPAIHTVSYYLTEDDAENQVNPLDRDQWTNIVPDFQKIYVRVQRNDEYPCYRVKWFFLMVSRTIENPEANDETFCLAEDSPSFIFDLNEKDDDILDGADADYFNIHYYNSQNDAQNRMGDFTQVNSNNFPKTVFFRVESSSFQGCFETGSFILDKQNGVQAKEPDPILICDTEERGTYSFNLAEKDAEIMNGQSSTEYKVTYFHSEGDAHNNLNEINKENYECGVGSTILYAQLSPLSAGCSSIVNLHIEVSELPQPDLADSYQICAENESLNIDGGDFETWEWLDVNYDTIGVERTINITEPGDYGLTVTKYNAGNTCQKTVFFTVDRTDDIGSISHNVTGIESDMKLSIETEVSGDYEYSIDGINFQSSNYFNVSPGIYDLYVRDRSGCATANTQITIQGYQEYFTPNSDGINDEWEIVATEDGRFLDVLIYDRYGKLLAQILSGKQGWDGNYNGKPMPSDDYWFSIEYPDGQIATGHFSLVRS